MSRKRISSREFVTVDGIAGYCMVSQSTVRRWAHDGTLHAIKLPSGHFRVSITDFKDFLEQHNIPVAEELLES
ncbi:MAG: hypothetical protein A2147_06655 [Chloroflexi bacterium RBG_16_57_8]|nr:MAG: hypothetical protein A2147_06655 [Chloroflexi bacterium RBG_16_57_8]